MSELYRRVEIATEDGGAFDYVRDTEAEKWVRLGRAMCAGAVAWLNESYDELAEAMIAAIEQEYA